MENAILIYKIENLNYSLKYDRLYYGHEFCENLLPKEQELKQVIDFSCNNKLPFTFVTPFVSDHGIFLLMKLINILFNNIKYLIKPEIVINDLGVLNMIKNNLDISIIAGRLMSKQKRDPRIAAIHSLTHEAKKYYANFSLDSLNSKLFLSQFNIKRIELDNVLQKIARQSNISASLYMPYVYISTTRLCYIAQSDKKEKYFRKIVVCDKECQNYDVYMKSKQINNQMYLKGNTFFYKNDMFPDNINELNIDRIVNNSLI